MICSEIVAKKSKVQSGGKTNTRTRGLLKVKDLDYREPQDEFERDRNFELRGTGVSQKDKKKKCCS
jgi:hypothetical protein